MTGLELDRQVSHRGGTWAIGFGVSQYRATAAALGADHVSRSGDQTSFRIIPLWLLAVYRADGLRTRFGSPVIPYAKRLARLTLQNYLTRPAAYVDLRRCRENGAWDLYKNQPSPPWHDFRV